MSAEITSAKVKINDILQKNIIQQSHDTNRIEYFVHALRVFQAEFAVQLKDWDLLSQQIDVSLDKNFYTLWDNYSLICRNW